MVTHIVVGTGTVPARPALPGMDLPGIYDSTTVQHADPFPERLAVIGGGFVGLEFANMLQLFGSTVTVLETAAVALPGVEPVVARAVADVLTRRGVTLRTGARVTGVRQSTDGLSVLLDDGGLDVDAVLVAVGRTPLTSDLDLDAAGIATDAKGFITVDELLRTSVATVGRWPGPLPETYASPVERSEVSALRCVPLGPASRRRISVALAAPPRPAKVHAEAPVRAKGL